MKSNYKRLGDFIVEVDIRNQQDKNLELWGVSIEKKFIKSVANIIGTDLSKYKIISKNCFVCSLMQVSRDEKIPIARWNDKKDVIVSPAYKVFRVMDTSIIMPEFMDLWFKRAEFDREASFYGVGGVRGSLEWEDFCEMRIPVPPIEEQEKIVDAYETIERRIALKRKINDNLESIAQTIFQEKFASYYTLSELPEGWKIVNLEKLCSVKGGKRLPADSELLDTPTEHPYIRVRDVGCNRYICLTNQFQYIDEKTHKFISRYIVNTNDIIISIVGTIGLIGKIHSSLNQANLTENCVKLSDIHIVTSDYLYYTLCYKKQIKEIELLAVGAVQAKLPMYNIQSMKILVPTIEEITIFQNKIDSFNKQIEANMIEIQKLYKVQETLLARISA